MVLKLSVAKIKKTKNQSTGENLDIKDGVLITSLTKNCLLGSDILLEAFVVFDRICFVLPRLN